MPLSPGIATAFDSASRMFAVVSGVVVAAIVVLNLYAPASPTLAARALASLLVAICAVPSLMWASKREWNHSFMPYVGVLYATYFATPIFLRQDFFGSWFSRPLMADAAIERALLLAIGGWVALMAGYFVVVRGKVADALPAVRVLPANDARLAGTVAVVVAVAAAPLLYLDNAAVVSMYAGETLLPSTITFPVTLAGQFIVFAVLVLFYLHLRGQLGLKGRVFMVALAFYYTVLGLSTGMVNHGLKAVFALFVAYAITAQTPTWRGIAYGLATAAILFFVLVPTRVEYRRLIWTHGVDAAATWRLSTHQFDTFDGSAPAFETKAYTISLQGRVLSFAHNDPGTCRGDDPRADASLGVFVHIDPVDSNDLPINRRQYGFDNLDFDLATGNVEDGRCVRHAPLPDYEINAIRAGLYRYTVPLSQKPYLPGRIELESAVLETPARADGEWQFETKDRSTWQIDPSKTRTSRLLLVLDDPERREDLALAHAGSVIRVVLDDDNWGEYVIGHVNVAGERVVFRLAALSDFQGGPNRLAGKRQRLAVPRADWADSRFARPRNVRRSWQKSVGVKSARVLGREDHRLRNQHRFGFRWRRRSVHRHRIDDRPAGPPAAAGLVGRQHPCSRSFPERSNIGAAALQVHPARLLRGQAGGHGGPGPTLRIRSVRKPGECLQGASTGRTACEFRHSGHARRNVRSRRPLSRPLSTLPSSRRVGSDHGRRDAYAHGADARDGGPSCRSPGDS